MAMFHRLAFGIFVVFFVLNTIEKCRCANILFTFFHDTGSHFQSMLPMMQRLAIRGNNVSVLDTVYARGQQSQAVQHIRAQLSQHNNDEKSKGQFAEFVWSKRMVAADLALYFGRCDQELGILMLNHSQTVVEVMNSEWDVIVVDDLFWTFGFALCTLRHRQWHSSRAGREPHIVVYATAQATLNTITSTRATGQFWVGRPTIGPVYPTDSSDVFSADRFIYRIRAFFEIIEEAIAVNFVAINFLMPNVAKFGVPNFSWFEFYWRSQLFLHDSIDRLGLPVTTAADIVNVGAHCKETKKDPSALPIKFKQLLEDPNSKGTIYIAFGSHVDWKYAPKQFLQIFIAVFQRLRQYRFIFVCNECKMPEDLQNSVLVIKWAPQLEVLAHPNVRAFVTHGGNKSVREGLCAEVALIVMPVYAEQAHTAQLLLKLNIASVINKFNFDEQSLFRTISNVVSRPETKARAKKILELFMDRQIPAIEEGAFAIERLVRRHSRGFTQFVQRKGMKLGWTEFAYFDAMIVLLILATTISF